MLILGIETSCDETSCAVVENGRRILSNSISSQIEIHRKTGGVVPEVAAREHVVKIVPVLEEALKKAGVTFSDIDGVAVTYGPGLLSSLIIGINAAMTVAHVLKKPLIPVNHIEGHIYANWLEVAEVPKFPAAVLTVSGGHNELLIWKGHGQYTFLGATLDDAAGEAFDKVARLLGLPYPGGPQIQKAAINGDPKRYPLPRSWLSDHPWDFSFSGLKTAVLRLVQEENGLKTLTASRQANTYQLTTQFVVDAAASFQESACEVLSTKLINAAQKFIVKEVHLAGGVSANARLREWTRQLLLKKFPEAIARPSLRFCTDLTLCTDNAAMIAAVGFFQYKKNPAQYKKWRPVTGNPNLEVKNW